MEIDKKSISPVLRPMPLLCHRETAEAAECHCPFEFRVSARRNDRHGSGGFSAGRGSESLESVIEQTKERYFIALRQTQSSTRTPAPDWLPWLTYFFGALVKQKTRVEKKLSANAFSWEIRGGRDFIAHQGASVVNTLAGVKLFAKQEASNAVEGPTSSSRAHSAAFPSIFKPDCSVVRERQVMRWHSRCDNGRFWPINRLLVPVALSPATYLIGDVDDPRRFGQRLNILLLIRDLILYCRQTEDGVLIRFRR